MPTDEPLLQIHKDAALPAWGPLSPEFMNGIDTENCPKDWQQGANVSGKEKNAHYDEWLGQTLRRIQKILWPVYVKDRQAWAGESITQMHALTKADLHLLAEAHLQLEASPTTPVSPTVKKNHLQLFQVEDRDGGADMFANYHYYDKRPDKTALRSIRRSAVTANDTKFGHTTATLKEQLQRPRPMQMSLLFPTPGYAYHEAVTSLSPSMCSGHAMQGVISIGGVLEEAAESGLLDPSMEIALGQWGVDIGDRRVFAGVHFPSDNLCSWIVFLRMADYLYRREEPRKIIAHAILHQSWVYARVHAERHPAHLQAIREIEYLAELPYRADRPFCELEPPAPVSEAS